jgi:hypothetical protein
LWRNSSIRHSAKRPKKERFGILAVSQRQQKLIATVDTITSTAVIGARKSAFVVWHGLSN